MAQPSHERPRVAWEVCAGEVGDDHPHPAADVRADGLGHDGATDREHRTHGDPAPPVEVGGEDHPLDAGALAVDVWERPERRVQVGDRGDLLERGALDVDLRVREERDGDARGRVDVRSRRVDALSGDLCHGGHLDIGCRPRVGTPYRVVRPIHVVGGDGVPSTRGGRMCAGARQGPRSTHPQSVRRLVRRRLWQPRVRTSTAPDPFERLEADAQKSALASHRALRLHQPRALPEAQPGEDLLA